MNRSLKYPIVFLVFIVVGIISVQFVLANTDVSCHLYQGNLCDSGNETIRLFKTTDSHVYQQDNDHIGDYILCCDKISGYITTTDCNSGDYKAFSIYGPTKVGGSHVGNTSMYNNFLCLKPGSGYGLICNPVQSSNCGTNGGKVIGIYDPDKTGGSHIEGPGGTDYPYSICCQVYPRTTPPQTPSTPSGPTSGYLDVSYDFSTSTTDPDGDQIRYGWDWNGDGIVDDWTGYYNSGATVTTSHSWISTGTYNIKVIAEDSNGAQSGWSNPHSITIQIPPGARRVFVINNRFNGNLGGLSGADQKCQDAASAAGLSNPSNFRAWLSTSSIDAKDHIDCSSCTGSNCMFIKLNGEKIADDCSDLLDGSLDSLINIDENGNTLTIETWTGTDPDGTVAPYTCNDWIDNTNSYNGQNGLSSRINSAWTNTEALYCNELTSLYCFEVLGNPPNQPNNPSPPDGATTQPTTVTLSVHVSDPDGDSMDVSFYKSDGTLIGTDTNVASGGTASVTWSGLSQGTTYFWYTIASDGQATNQSDTWTFTTFLPCDSSNECHSYTNSSGTYYCTQHEGTWVWRASSNPDRCGGKVIGIYDPDKTGGSHIEGPGGTDYPYSICCQVYPRTTPPQTPSTPSGPTSGYLDVSYDFSTSTTDPDGDQIRYGWDWNGDGIVDDWTGYYNSGATVTTSHSWISTGTYNIKVIAEDSNGAQSGWSNPHSITIQIPPGARRVFVINNRFNGNLGGLSGADQKCQDAASAAGLSNPSNFRAWLSTSSIDAKDHIDCSSCTGSNCMFIKLNGEKIADDCSDLLDGSLDSLINIDENGNTLTIETWTGTDPDGTVAPYTCNDWIDNTNSYNGQNGLSSRINSAWTNTEALYCNELTSLYCFEVLGNPPNQPNNPSPPDGATTQPTTVTLSVHVSDPDGDSMDVSFYKSDGTLIGTDTNVASGGTASVTWSGLSQGTTYFWYTIASDGQATNQSDTWTFTTFLPCDSSNECHSYTNSSVCHRNCYLHWNNSF